jgi:NADH-quinone oxidoreductase subunit G
MKTVNLTIDGLAVTVPEGTLLVEAAKQIQKDVPVYCYHRKLGPAGLCRICLVEVEKMPKLQIACNTVATEGMVVHTAGQKTEEGRRAVLEFLLLNHPLDCPICDKGGECDLQDFSMAYGQGASRKIEAKVAKPKAVELGPTIVLDEERCIVCQRCVRFDEIITQEQSLVVKDRGQHDLIATATGEPYVSSFSGNVTELCPVGALTSKTYRFRSRPWDLKRTTTTCGQCSVGCQMHVDERHGEVLRTMSVEDDDAVSDGWLCDRGRYNVGFYTDPRRIVSPLLREGGDWVQIGWDDAIEMWAKALLAALDDAGPQAIGAIGGGRLTNEEAYLLQRVFRGIGADNLDWRAGRQTFATAPVAGTYEDLENAQTIIVLGVPPSQNAPVMDLRIRKAVAHRGARLVAVSPFGTGSFVAETHVATVADIPADVLTAERIAVVHDGIDPSSLDALLQRLPSRAQISAFVPGEQPNARGAEAMGMLPRPGALDTRGMLAAGRDGTLHALALFGVNPVLRFADGALARAALERTPFVVVSELFMTETAQMASLILPARAQFEKDGHVTDMTGAVQDVWAAHIPPEGTLSDGEMLVALADACSVTIPAPHEIAAAIAEPAKVARPAAAPATVPSGGALRVAIGANIFAGGGTVWFDDRLGELRPVPAVALSPATAALLGIDSGDTVDLVAGDRTVANLRVHVYEDAADGVAGIVDGLPDAPANVLAAGESVTVANHRAARELAGTGAA